MLEGAFDVRYATVKQRSAEDAHPPVQPGKLILCGASEPPRDVLLVRREHVDGKMAAPAKSLQARRAMVNAEEHKWRLKRHGRKRVGREAVAGAVVAAGRHYRHAR